LSAYFFITTIVLGELYSTYQAYHDHKISFRLTVRPNVNKLLVQTSLANTLHVYRFSADYTLLEMENSMKSISTVNPANMKNTEDSLVKMRATAIDQ